MTQDYKEALIIRIFSEGAQFDKEHFTKIAKALKPTIHTARTTERDVIKANLELVSTQQTVNKYLRSHGRMLKSRNYYGEFYVVCDKPALKEVARYNRTAKTMSTCAEKLTAGMEMRQKALDLVAM